MTAWARRLGQRCAQVAIAAALAVLGLGVAAVAALPPPVPGQPARLVTFPGAYRSVLDQVLRIDADARLVGVGFGGSVITVIYRRSDLPERLGAAVPVWLIGGGGAGCT